MVAVVLMAWRSYAVASTRIYAATSPSCGRPTRSSPRAVGNGRDAVRAQTPAWAGDLHGPSITQRPPHETSEYVPMTCQWPLVPHQSGYLPVDSATIPLDSGGLPSWGSPPGTLLGPNAAEHAGRLGRGTDIGAGFRHSRTTRTGPNDTHAAFMSLELPAV